MSIGLTPIRKTLEIPRGAQFQDTITVRDAAGDVVDISAFTAVLEIKERYYDRTLVTLTEVSGLTLGADGVIVIVIDEATTTAMRKVDYPANYSLKITSNVPADGSDMVLDGIAALIAGTLV